MIHIYVKIILQILTKHWSAWVFLGINRKNSVQKVSSLPQLCFVSAQFGSTTNFIFTRTEEVAIVCIRLADEWQGITETAGSRGEVSREQYGGDSCVQQSLILRKVTGRQHRMGGPGRQRETGSQGDPPLESWVQRGHEGQAWETGLWRSHPKLTQDT